MELQTMVKFQFLEGRQNNCWENWLSSVERTLHKQLEQLIKELLHLNVVVRVLKTISETTESGFGRSSINREDLLEALGVPSGSLSNILRTTCKLAKQ